VEEVRIHTGSRIRLSQLEEDVLPHEFVARLKEYAHQEEQIQAIFMFTLQTESQTAQASMAVALKTGLFSKKDESFLRVVDEIQLMLPDDLSLNLYRFGASDFLAKYCVHNIEPLYLRTEAWLVKHRKKYPQG
jgi:hypothetical protein